MAPTAPGAAKSAPRRREYLGTKWQGPSAHSYCPLPLPSHPSLMPHGQPFLAPLVFSSVGQLLSVLSLPWVGTHGWVMENWVVPHFWVFFMPTPLLFPPYLTLASPCAPCTACFKHPRFLPSQPPLPYKPHFLWDVAVPVVCPVHHLCPATHQTWPWQHQGWWWGAGSSPSLPLTAPLPCSELKKTTGDWFYDQRVNRFANRLGSDMVRLSLRHRSAGRGAAAMPPPTAQPSGVLRLSLALLCPVRSWLGAPSAPVMGLEQWSSSCLSPSSQQKRDCGTNPPPESPAW